MWLDVGAVQHARLMGLLLTTLDAHIGENLRLKSPGTQKTVSQPTDRSLWPRYVPTDRQPPAGSTSDPAAALDMVSIKSGCYFFV
jgi:hypothetical protein